MFAYRLIDEVTEDFLDLIDSLNEEVEELDDHIEDWSPQQTLADGSRIFATTSCTFVAPSPRRATPSARSSTTVRMSRKERTLSS